MDLASLIIENGGNVDIKNNKGETPLMWAAGSGHLKLVKTLLEKGANPNLRDSEKRSLIKITSYDGHDHVVQHLEMLQSVNSKLFSSIEKKVR